MQGYWKTSQLEAENTAYLEGLYEAYLADPNAVSAEWRAYFNGIKGDAKEVNHSEIQAAFVALAKQPGGVVAGEAQDSPENEYRAKGHLAAAIDPLQLEKVPSLSELGLDSGLKQFQAWYCGSIGSEFMYIEDEARRNWVAAQVESQKPLSVEQKKMLLERLVAADGLEKYLGTQYPGQKRFSLEGGDGFIPMMSVLIESAVQKGAKEIAIGMAHRGRLNVLINIMGQAPRDLFAEFEGVHDNHLIAGDVKYHNGFSSDVKVASGTVHLSLAFNPSHLEIVSPVVEGSVRARQVRRSNKQDEVLALQVHGDAAFAGQGCNYEMLNMAHTQGFGNGGSIHIVINNQVGFTTSPSEARSTRYCTDIAKMLGAPVFHVNGHDPEAILRVSEWAVAYRQAFKRDVFIDLVCYRRHGHNEADEPSGTQPLMYQVIKSLPAPAKVYADRLVAEKVLSDAEFVAMQQAYKQALDKGDPVVDLIPPAKNKPSAWKPFENKPWRAKAPAPIPVKTLQKWCADLSQVPADFSVQAQVAKVIQERAKMGTGELPFNWGGAEILAYASLIAEGIPVRLCGEDSGRGTFSHRHAVWKDQKTGKVYIPLQHFGRGRPDIAAGEHQDPVPFTVIDSVLSEEAVLAFEYGYADSTPNGLTLWEAQYGDFANGAQVVIDQFISAAEEKWGRLCGLTLLLPHGQQGEGPEHSSARLERFLQLCANENMQVCAPTTPAQIYHLLRRQVLRPYRKPLVIMSPKSLLRHPLVTSSLKDLAEGQFEPVLPEQDVLSKKPKRVIFCQGKVYYDLLAKRREQKIEDIAILRIEQMYPFPDQEVAALISAYKGVKDWVWCQEEPHNQGAWFKVRDDFAPLLPAALRYVGRPAYASPAVGYSNVFKQGQEQLVAEALSDSRDDER